MTEHPGSMSSSAKSMKLMAVMACTTLNILETMMGFKWVITCYVNDISVQLLQKVGRSDLKQLGVEHLGF